MTWAALALAMLVRADLVSGVLVGQLLLDLPLALLEKRHHLAERPLALWVQLRAEQTLAACQGAPRLGHLALAWVALEQVQALACPAEHHLVPQAARPAGQAHPAVHLAQQAARLQPQQKLLRHLKKAQ
jgi:hypothetical protein